jgi:hypothetical protein
MFPEGFILGLSTGAVCVAYCGPVLLPFILGEGTTVIQNAKSVGLFLGGRLLAYILVGFFFRASGNDTGSGFTSKQVCFWDHIYTSGCIYDRLWFLQIQGNMPWAETAKAAAETGPMAFCNTHCRWIRHGHESLSALSSCYNGGRGNPSGVWQSAFFYHVFSRNFNLFHTHAIFGFFQKKKGTASDRKICSHIGRIIIFV